MATVASRRRVLPRATLLPRAMAGPALILLVLLAVSLFMRTLALGDSFWMDEGLSVGIGSQPFLDIPGVLRQDGSPPLYYMLLHVWMAVFGQGQATTQALSVLIALLTVPSALWAGWTLFGRQAGLISAALAALNPFLTLYAQEARMYALMILLSLLASAALVHAFVYGRRVYLAPFAVMLALMLYTHNWGLFFTAGCLAALVPILRAARNRREVLRDGALAFGGAGLLYAPWLPTLAFQAAHTGAPWVNSPRLGGPLQIGKSVLGGAGGTVALALGTGAGLAGVLGTRAPGRPASRDRTAVLALLTIPVATLVVAWLFSQLSPAWTTRYLGVILGPVFLLGGLGLARAGRLGVVALLIVLAFWAVPRTYDPTHKSNADELAVAAAPLLERGDLVISTQPEQAPLLNYQLPDGLRYATILGPVANPNIMDWRDSLEEMERARPETTLDPVLDRVPVSSRVLLVRPVTILRGDWDAPWTRLVRRRSAQWGQALASDRRFTRRAVIPRFYTWSTRIGVRGVVYEKTRP